MTTQLSINTMHAITDCATYQHALHKRFMLNNTASMQCTVNADPGEQIHCTALGYGSIFIQKQVGPINILMRYTGSEEAPTTGQRTLWTFSESSPSDESSPVFCFVCQSDDKTYTEENALNGPGDEGEQLKGDNVKTVEEFCLALKKKIDVRWTQASQNLSKQKDEWNDDQYQFFGCNQDFSWSERWSYESLNGPAAKTHPYRNPFYQLNLSDSLKNRIKTSKATNARYSRRQAMLRELEPEIDRLSRKEKGSKYKRFERRITHGEIFQLMLEGHAGLLITVAPILSIQEVEKLSEYRNTSAVTELSWVSEAMIKESQQWTTLVERIVNSMPAWSRASGVASGGLKRKAQGPEIVPPRKRQYPISPLLTPGADRIGLNKRSTSVTQLPSNLPTSNQLHPDHKRKPLIVPIDVCNGAVPRATARQRSLQRACLSPSSSSPGDANPRNLPQSSLLTISNSGPHALVNVPPSNQGFFSDYPRVLRSPSLPPTLLVPENLFYSVKEYFESSCRNMILDNHGTLITSNGAELRNDLCNDFDSYCFTATMLIEKGLHVEFGRALSKASALVEQILRAEHPRTLACFLEVFIHLIQNGLTAVTSLLCEFIKEMSAKVIRKGHPWAQICQLLGELDTESFADAMAQTWKCTTDIFDIELGPFSRLAVSVRLDYIKRVYGITNYGEEERLLRNLLTQLGNIPTHPKPRVMLNLAHNLNRQERHDDAEAMALEVHSLLQREGIYARRVVERIESLKIVSYSQFNQGNAASAEQTMHEAMELIVDQWGIQHPWILEFKNVLEGWLRAWGREEDANKLRGEIEELMGKDENC